jgi:hypothetical protein
VSWRYAPDADAALVGDPQASGECFLFEQPNHAGNQAKHRRLILARWAQDHDASVLARWIGSKIGKADVKGQARAPSARATFATCGSGAPASDSSYTVAAS